MTSPRLYKAKMVSKHSHVAPEKLHSFNPLNCECLTNTHSNNSLARTHDLEDESALLAVASPKHNRSVVPHEVHRPQNLCRIKNNQLGPQNRKCVLSMIFYSLHFRAPSITTNEQNTGPQFFEPTKITMSTDLLVPKRNCFLSTSVS